MKVNSLVSSSAVIVWAATPLVLASEPTNFPTYYPTSEPSEEVLPEPPLPEQPLPEPPANPCVTERNAAIACLQSNKCFGFGESRRLGDHLQQQEQEQQQQNDILKLDDHLRRKLQGGTADCDEFYLTYCNEMVTIANGCDVCTPKFEALYECNVEKNVNDLSVCDDRPDGSEGCTATYPCLEACETSCRTENKCSSLPRVDMSCAVFDHFYCFTQNSCEVCSDDTEACYKCRLEKEEIYSECSLPDMCQRYHHEYGCWVFADEETCHLGQNSVYRSETACQWDASVDLCTEPIPIGPQERGDGKKTKSSPGGKKKSGGKKDASKAPAPDGKKGRDGKKDESKAPAPDGKKGDGKKDESKAPVPYGKKSKSEGKKSRRKKGDQLDGKKR